jgi:hypothetical protein
MKKSKRRDRQPEAGKPDLPARRMPVWLPGAVLVLLLVGIGVGVWAMNRTRADSAIAPASAAPASSMPATSPAIPAEVRQRLVGRWLRPDGGYVLSIKSIGEDGKVDAAYNNPQPIKVAKAQVTQEAGKTALFVELRDRNYPGNYYTLSYDPGQDQLVGIYQHLGLNQTFDVNFVRIGQSEGGASPPR